LKEKEGELKQWKQWHIQLEGEIQKKQESLAQKKANRYISEIAEINNELNKRKEELQWVENEILECEKCINFLKNILNNYQPLHNRLKKISEDYYRITKQKNPPLFCNIKNYIQEKISNYLQNKDN